MGKYKTMIVDDHDVVRAGLTALLEDSEFAVTTEAGSVAEAVSKARLDQPDVALVDVRLPDGSGVDVCRQVLADSSQTRILMLTSYADEEIAVASIEAGAAGFVLKEISRNGLIEAIRKIVHGEVFLDSAVTSGVLNRLRGYGIKADKPSVLTRKETEVMLAVAKGKSNKQIAQDLFLSEYTVRNYVSSILDKLNLRSRAQLVNYVFEHRLNCL